MNIATLFGLKDDGVTIPALPQTPRDKLRASHRHLQAAMQVWAQTLERRGRPVLLGLRLDSLEDELRNVLQAKDVLTRITELDAKITETNKELMQAVDDNLQFGHDDLESERNFRTAKQAHIDAIRDVVLNDDLPRLARRKAQLYQKLIEVDAVLQGYGQGAIVLDGGSEIRKQCEVVRRNLPPPRGDQTACASIVQQQRDEEVVRRRTVAKFKDYINNLVADPDAELEIP